MAINNDSREPQPQAAWPDPVNLSASDGNEINLFEIWSLLWEEKVLILSIVGLFALGSLFYSLSLTKIYRAEALLAPAEVRQSNNPLLGELGGAATLIGINIENQSGDRVDTAMATLKSREFARQFIATHNLLPMLMAGTWNDAEQRSIIDRDLYDEESNAWVGRQPTEWDAFKRFNGIVAVSQNRTNGLVTVAVEWHDPYQAKDWVNLMVADVNNLIKQQDLEESTSAIEFLQAQLESTQLLEMQRVFYQLIESQTRIVMLAGVRDDYVFRVIDPAVVPEDKIRPSRAMICIVGTLLGGILALFVVFIRRLYDRNKSTELETA